jgi:hypothetical protein
MNTRETAVRLILEMYRGAGIWPDADKLIAEARKVEAYLQGREYIPVTAEDYESKLKKESAAIAAKLDS